MTDIRSIAAARSRNDAAVRAVLADPSLLRPVYQPIVDLVRGVVCGYELLARFALPVDGTPDHWFAAAERLGLGGWLEAIVLRHALDVRDDLPANCFLAVNLSPSAAVSPEIRALIAGQSDLGGVVIEVTEQAQVTDYDQLLAALAPARAAGATLAVDDVGTGYAGLEQIMALRPDFVKTDRSLVHNLDTDEVRAAGVEMLGAFAGRIDAWLIAEGLETPAEIEAAQALGIPLGQGFGLARPGALGERLDPGASARLQGRSAVGADAGSVGEFVESLPVWLPESDPRGWTVRVDDHMRPLALNSPDGDVIADPMRVLATERASEVARRAMTRDQHKRFTPLVCCGDLGRVYGLLRMERLVKALADMHVASTPGGCATGTGSRSSGPASPTAGWRAT